MMSKKLYISYKDENIALFDFEQYENMAIEESFMIADREYKLMAVLGQKGACSLIIKYKGKMVYATTTETTQIGIPNVTLFFLIAKDEYLQVGFHFE
jgi:hypothetical protein